MQHSKDLGEYVLSLFVFFYFGQTYICRKNSKNMENIKKVPLFRDFHGTFRLLENSGGIFHNSGPEFRLLAIPEIQVI